MARRAYPARATKQVGSSARPHALGINAPMSPRARLPDRSGPCSLAGKAAAQEDGTVAAGLYSATAENAHPEAYARGKILVATDDSAHRELTGSQESRQTSRPHTHTGGRTSRRLVVSGHDVGNTLGLAEDGDLSARVELLRSRTVRQEGSPSDGDARPY